MPIPPDAPSHPDNVDNSAEYNDSTSSNLTLVRVASSLTTSSSAGPPSSRQPSTSLPPPEPNQMTTTEDIHENDGNYIPDDVDSNTSVVYSSDED